MKRKLVFPLKKKDNLFEQSFNEDSIMYSIENSKLLFNDFASVKKIESLNKVSSFSLNSSSVLSIAKTKGCDLLPGSFLEANTLFGSDISRTSHLDEIEKVINSCNTDISKLIPLTNEAFSESFSFKIINGKIILGENVLFDKFVDESDMDCKYFTCSVAYDKTGDSMITVTFNKTAAKETIVIESDIPIEVTEGGETPKALRIISPSVYFSAPISSRSIEVIADCCCIDNDCDCNAMILRCDDLEIKKQVVTYDFLFIGNDLDSKNLLCVYNSIFISSLGDVKISQINATNAFIHCDTLTFKKSIIISENLYTKAIKIDTTKTCTVSAKKYFVEGHKVTNNGKINASIKLSLLLLFEKKDEEVFANKGSISTFDFFVEANCCAKMKPGMIGRIRNYNALTVYNSFLLSNGHFITKNATIRSLYVPEYNMFESKGELAIGDFLVVENNSEFIHTGTIRPYSGLKPMVIISGKFSCKKPIKVGKFVSNGTLMMSLVIESDDIVSLSCKGEIDNLEITAPHIAVSEKAKIIANKVKLIAQKVEIAKRALRPAGEETEIEIGTNDSNIKDDFDLWSKKNIHEIETVQIKKEVKVSKRLDSISTPPVKRKELVLPPIVKE